MDLVCCNQGEMEKLRTDLGHASVDPLSREAKSQTKQVSQPQRSTKPLGNEEDEEDFDYEVEDDEIEETYDA